METPVYQTNDSEYFPMLVSDTYPQEDTRDTILARWALFDALEQKYKDILIDPQTPDRIFLFAKKYSLSKEQSALISLLIRYYALQSLSETSLKNTLITNFPSQSREIYFFITTFFQYTPSKKEIPHEVPTVSKSSSPTVYKNFSQALSIYPRIGQQLVTSEDIVIRGSQEPVRPSVKNWITLYQQEMGPAPHEAFERSNFLFHNKNVLNLSPRDREKITHLLTSLDENIPLPLNIQSQEILWEKLKNSSEKEIISSQKRRPLYPQNISFPQIKNEKSLLNQETPLSSPTFNSASYQESASFFSEKFKTKTKDSFNARNINFSSSHLFPKEKEESQE
ncbi:MAG: hypothetical protein EOM19_01565 [Candidatus Moranbacteria bacterium]|nr:hypothetical protein [Candidatus Moranbacteria bacterium]